MISDELAELIEQLAEEVWERLLHGYQLGVSQGEETITDLLLLDLAIFHSPNMHTLKTPKLVEAQIGCDWEWWIGSDSRGWFRFAIQAKKADREHRYSSLTHKVGNRLQIDILEEYAAKQGALPLYCFYNYPDQEPLANLWSCCDGLNEPQLGCTLVPIGHVRKAIETHGGKNFRFLHCIEKALPWRCLFRCPRSLGVLDAPNDDARNAALADAPVFDMEVDNFWTKLPESVALLRLQDVSRVPVVGELIYNLEEDFEADALSYFKEDAYGDMHLLPRRVAIMDMSSREEHPDDDKRAAPQNARRLPTGH